MRLITYKVCRWLAGFAAARLDLSDRILLVSPKNKEEHRHFEEFASGYCGIEADPNDTLENHMVREWAPEIICYRVDVTTFEADGLMVADHFTLEFFGTSVNDLKEHLDMLWLGYIESHIDEMTDFAPADVIDDRAALRWKEDVDPSLNPPRRLGSYTASYMQISCRFVVSHIPNVTRYNAERQAYP